MVVAPGSYKIYLGGIPANCTPQRTGGGPWTVEPWATTNITWGVTCAPPATLRVTASTTGPNAPETFNVDVDPTISGRWDYRMIVPSHGTDSAILEPGSHTVKLQVPLNCFVGPNPVLVTLTSGATTDLGFTVACQ